MGERQNGMKRKVISVDESNLSPVAHSATKSGQQLLQRLKVDNIVQPRKILKLQNAGSKNFVCSHPHISTRGVDANKVECSGRRNRKLAQKKSGAVLSRLGKGWRTIGIQCNLDVPENHNSGNLPKTRHNSNDNEILGHDNDYIFPKLISPRLRGEQFEECPLDLGKDIFDTGDLFDEEFDLFGEQQSLLDDNFHSTTRSSQNRVPPHFVSENMPDVINDKKKRKLRVRMPILLDGYALPDR